MILEFYFSKNFLKVLKSYIYTYLISYSVLEIQTLPFLLNKFLLILKYNQLYLLTLCIDIFAVDFPGKYFRFTLIYNFLSIIYNYRLRFLVQTNEIFPLESITNLFPSAAWAEREVWDLSGIFFLYNVDLRRILTDYGFIGAPLRKDFPLSGFVEISFDDISKHIFYNKIELNQAYRVFKYNNPWKLATY